MKDKALVVIDIQNDITKNYKEIIGNINAAIDWAAENEIHIVYIKHNNLSAGTRTFKPDTRGAELVSDMKIVSENVFVKSKGNALTSEGFASFINENGIKEFYVAGADAGGMYGNSYVMFEGGTLGFAYISGKVAGENAADHAAGQ